MTITSNSAEVLARTAALPARLQGAHDRALANHGAWEKEARAEALSTLQALARPEQIPLAVRFAHTVSAGVFGDDGLVLRMRNPAPALLALMRQSGKILAGEDLVAEMQRGANRPEFERLILEWVQEEKDKDQRDAGKSDAEIANLISYIMLSPHLEQKGRDAREALLPHIIEFIQVRSVDLAISRETMNEWMTAVLAAWRAWARVRYRERVREELRKP